MGLSEFPALRVVMGPQPTPRIKVGEKAALPPELRKASGFPPRTASILALGSAGRLSLPTEPRGSVRVEAHGKAEPFRKSGGRATLEC